MDTIGTGQLASAKSLIIALPQNPQLDWVAAALALSSSLQKSGKTVTVACSTPLTVDFSRIVGVDKITTKIGDKNLSIKFLNYSAQQIDTVTYTVENDQFELVVVTKDGYVPPKTDQIRFAYSGTGADCAVFIAVTDKNQLGKIAGEEMFKVPQLGLIANFDTRPAIDYSFTMVDPLAASTSEIVVRYLEDTNLPFDQDVASSLLFGIESATGNFSSNAVSADTFEAAAICLRHGAIRHTTEVKKAQSGSVSRFDENLNPVPTPEEIKAPAPVHPEPPSGSSPKQPSPAQSVLQQNAPLPPAKPKKQNPSPEWLEPKIYTGRSVV
jgi:hypothetical protein